MNQNRKQKSFWRRALSFLLCVLMLYPTVCLADPAAAIQAADTDADYEWNTVTSLKDAIANIKVGTVIQNFFYEEMADTYSGIGFNNIDEYNNWNRTVDISEKGNTAFETACKNIDGAHSFITSSDFTVMTVSSVEVLDDQSAVLLKFDWNEPSHWNANSILKEEVHVDKTATTDTTTNSAAGNIVSSLKRMAGSGYSWYKFGLMTTATVERYGYRQMGYNAFDTARQGDLCFALTVVNNAVQLGVGHRKVSSSGKVSYEPLAYLTLMQCQKDTGHYTSATESACIMMKLSGNQPFYEEYESSGATYRNSYRYAKGLCYGKPTEKTERENERKGCNSFLLEVSTGTPSGSNVQYFCIEYTDTHDVKRTEYVFPHEELETSQLVYLYKYGTDAERVWYGYSERSLNRMREIEKYVDISFPSFEKNTAGGLGAEKTDQYLVTLPFGVKSIDDISFFIAKRGGKITTQSQWYCRGLRLYQIVRLYGREMVGSYSAESYWDFDGNLVAYATFSNGVGNQFGAAERGTTFRLSEGKNKYGFHFDSRALNADSASYSTRNLEKDMTFRLDFADVNGGGIEALISDNILGLLQRTSGEASEKAQDTMNSALSDWYSFHMNYEVLQGEYQYGYDPEHLDFIETLLMDVSYRDTNGMQRTVSLPVISSFIGWADAHCDGFSSLKLGGIAGQGDTLVFNGILPDFSSISKITLRLGEDAVLDAGFRKPSDSKGKSDVQKSREIMMDTESINILGASIYETAYAQASTSFDGCMLQTTVRGTPIYYYAADNAEGTLIRNNGFFTTNTGVSVSGGTAQNGSYSDFLLLPSSDNRSTFLLELCTDTIEGSSTTENLQLTVHYTDKDGAKRSAGPYQISDEVGEYYGYWDCARISEDEASPIPYMIGTQEENSLLFPITIPNVEVITGITLAVSKMTVEGSSAVDTSTVDDYQMSFFNIYEGSAGGRRVISWQDGITLYGDIYLTEKLITRELDRGKRLMSYNNKVYLNKEQFSVTVTFDGVGGGTVTDDSEELNWEEYKEEMSYNETKMDLGFAKAAHSYRIDVDVAENGIEANNEEYGDCGSINDFYFQLIFSDMKSGYVLANLQLTADGFRAGQRETFYINMNRDYGTLVAIRIIPDDSIDDENANDKLNIAAITVSEISSAAISRTWVFDHVGWIGTGFTDTGAQSSEKGQTARMENEVMNQYLKDTDSYAINLMISVTTGASTFSGGLRANITYENSDHMTVETGMFDVAKYFADYAGKTSASLNNFSCGGVVMSEIDNSYMLRSNHTDRMILPVPDAVSIKSITFVAYGKKVMSWNIKEVDVYQVLSDGIVYLNAAGEYKKSNAVSYLCRTEGADAATLDVVSPGTSAECTLSFTENTISVNPKTWEASIQRVSEAGAGDSLNLYIYPAQGVSSYDISGLTAKMNYTKWQEDITGETELTSFHISEDGSFLYTTDFELSGLLALTGMTLSTKSRSANIDRVVVQHVRSDVIVENYLFDFEDTESITSSGVSVEPQKIENGKQVLTFRFDNDTWDYRETKNGRERIPIVLSDGSDGTEERDVAVCFLYTSNYGTHGTTYQSKKVFLTDKQIASVKAGDVISVEFDESEVAEVVGYAVGSIGQMTATVDKAVLSTYTGTKKTGYEYDTDYSFGKSVPVNRVMTSTTVTEEPIALLTLDLEISEEARNSSDVDTVSMKLLYVENHDDSKTDTECEKELVIEDISEYITDGSVNSGKATVKLFVSDMKSIGYLYFEPHGLSEETVAQWGLRHITVNKTEKNETTLIADERTEQTVFEGKGIYFNLRAVSLIVNVALNPISGVETEGNESRFAKLDMRSNELNLTASYSQQLTFTVKLINGVPCYGYRTEVLYRSAGEGEFQKANPNEIFFVRDDAAYFNPIPNALDTEYLITIFSEEKEEQYVTIDLTYHDRSQVSAQTLELQFSWDTMETQLVPGKQDILLGFTYYADEETGDAQLRRTNMYRLSSLVGIVSGNNPIILPAAISAGSLLESIVVMTEGDLSDICLSDLLIYEDGGYYAYTNIEEIDFGQISEEAGDSRISEPMYYELRIR